ncbi:Unknown protein [Striga hermonthica]|uniref:F-box associated beta-propeller type 1 domain-containing protein n=1 Tax=Striga hermonthica TaxID=68872 RepID=A0A9N7NFG7_STRHE|nr:Unknown protein [Striga hermonthica]
MALSSSSATTANTGLRSKSWKRIEDKCSSRLCIWSEATLLNGTLYWFTEERGELIALDLATEKFRKLPLPFCDMSYVLHSKVLGGRLVVFQDEDLCTGWVLKDYGALKPEWVRLMITPMGLSLIKEETRLVIPRDHLIFLWDVHNHSKKLIRNEMPVKLYAHIVGESIFRFGVKRNWSEVDDKR